MAVSQHKFKKKIIDTIRSIGGDIVNVYQNGHLKFEAKLPFMSEVETFTFPSTPSNNCASEPKYIKKQIKQQLRLKGYDVFQKKARTQEPVQLTQPVQPTQPVQSVRFSKGVSPYTENYSMEQAKKWLEEFRWEQKVNRLANNLVLTTATKRMYNE